MEKEIYLTESPFSIETSNEVVLNRDRPSAARVPKGILRQVPRKCLNRLPDDSYYLDKHLKPGINLFKVRSSLS